MNTSLDTGFLSITALTAREPSSGQSGRPDLRGLPDLRDASDTAELPDVLALLFDELSYGVLVLGKQRRVLHANEAARRELERCGVLQVRDGELQTLSLIDGKALYIALSQAAAGKRSLLKLAASGMTLSLSVVPLGGNLASEPGYIALFFARGELCDTGMFSFFSRSHSLTPAEEQVLVLLCRSLSTPEIAVQLKVAVSTVRSHVRSLCAKTGSSGARELVNLVASLPPAGLSARGKIH